MDQDQNPFETPEAYAAAKKADEGIAIQDGAAAQVAPVASDSLQQSQMFWDMIGGMASGYAPKSAQYWQPAISQRIAAAWVPIMEKYQMDMTRIPPELTFMVIAGPPLYMTMKAVIDQIKDDKAEAKRQQLEASNAANQAHETTPVAPEAV